MIKLSYSSLNQLHEASHQWINRQLGIKVPDYEFLREGKEAHRLIQLHVSGKKKHPHLKHIDMHFPIVEPDIPDDHPNYWDLKEVCKFSFPLKSDKGEFLISGYYDGLDKKKGRILEIKSSSTIWGLGKFRNSIQRKLYGLSDTKLKEAVLITCARNVEKWEKEPPKLYSVPYTPKDYSDAVDWIAEGINILLKGDFTGGLDEDGKCTGCFYGQNCNFL
jgi:hypothetical protein